MRVGGMLSAAGLGGTTHAWKSYRREENRGGRSDVTAWGLYREITSPVYSLQGQNCKSKEYLIV